MSLRRRSRPRRTQHPVQVGGHAPQPALTAGEAYAADLSDRVAAAARHRCQARIHRDCPDRGDQAHHRWRRSHQGPDTLGNCRWVCHLCHDVIHFRRVGWARRHLWLIDAALGQRLAAAGLALPAPAECPLDCMTDHRPDVTVAATAPHPRHRQEVPTP